MFGVQFYQLVLQYSHENNAEFMIDNELLSDVDQNQWTLEEREERFEQNSADLMSGSQLQFYPMNDVPAHTREIIELLKVKIGARELKSLLQGTLYSENMINLHFKIMDKMNLMLNTAYDLQMKTPQGDDGLQQIPPMDRVMFCNGDFMRKFRKYF